jgi:hypothetical protein
VEAERVQACEVERKINLMLALVRRF